MSLRGAQRRSNPRMEGAASGMGSLRSACGITRDDNSGTPCHCGECRDEAIPRMEGAASGMRSLRSACGITRDDNSGTPCHCEECSDEAIPVRGARLRSGIPSSRCIGARNDRAGGMTETAQPLFLRRRESNFNSYFRKSSVNKNPPGE
jgi:hypothetical protein